MGSVLPPSNNKPHAVCIPYPAQGHINPMLKLAKLLHHHGFHITFVNSEFNHKRLLKTQNLDSLNKLPTFQFETIPDGLPPTDADATQDIPSLCASTEATCLVPFRNLLAKLNDTTSSGVPPVSCIISDGIMTFTIQAAQELGIPDVLFWTTSVCGFYAYDLYKTLIERRNIPLQEESCLTNGYLDTVVEDLPGIEGIRLRDFPSFVRTTDPDAFMIKYVNQQTDRARKASVIIFNTFEGLEIDALNALSTIFPPIYAIGPLHLLVEKVADDKRLNEIGSSLWKEDTTCIDWLDTKAPNSVIYVNFGSITVMTPDQMMEFAWGLANSNQTFLWIIRPDLVKGKQAMLPPEFLEATKERSMLVNWCPQEKVLNHPSVGGFLTHSGWNSTLESISSGVPMICWPFFAEQQTNCWYSCTKWGVGMEIDSDVKRDEVEILVRELAVGDKGKEMKARAMDWKKMAKEFAKSSGHENLEKLINQVLLPGKQE